LSFNRRNYNITIENKNNIFEIGAIIAIIFYRVKMKNSKFNQQLLDSFLEELSDSHLAVQEKSTIVAKMLSICSFQEQEMLSSLLRNQGFIFNIYQNPTPVAAALVPISTNDGIRLLSIVRNIHPKKGEVGLPGGYVDKFETFEQASARETFEETGLKLKPENFSLMVSKNTPTNNTLVFCTSNQIVKASDLDLDFKNEETQKIVLASQEQEYCFSTHNEVSKMFWKNIHNYL
jgi:ADP-ribose pyrophosphatase YjhB (NUDIX family)